MTTADTLQDAAGTDMLRDALSALVRLLARQAAREALCRSPIEQKDNHDGKAD